MLLLVWTRNGVLPNAWSCFTICGFIKRPLQVIVSLHLTEASKRSGMIAGQQVFGIRVMTSRADIVWFVVEDVI